MKAIHSGREAKEFLIAEIVAEAQRENVPLSEVERKMLYFSESGWTLPDIMKVAEDFDREYDQDKYKQKIAKLVTKADRHIRKGPRDDYDRWWTAIRFLQQEDHYISVMIRLAGLRSRGDQLRLFAAGLGIATAILLMWTFFRINSEKPSAESGTSPAAASAAPPAAPSPAPSGVFVHKDRATSPGGYEVEFYSILRFGRDGQVCSMNVSTELDDEVLSRYSKSCDAREKDREYGKYTFVNGTITFSLGESDYSGVFDQDRLILTTVYRPTQKTSTDEYRHHDVGYDNQEQQSIPSGPK